MTAASYWSLLAPAIEMAERSGSYGDDGQWAFVPVSIGFALGAAFVYGADIFMPYLVSSFEVSMWLNSRLPIFQLCRKFDSYIVIELLSVPLLSLCKFQPPSLFCGCTT